MHRYFADEYLYFEKIKRRKNKKELEKEELLFEKSQLELINSQIFGSIHTIDEQKIPNFITKKSLFDKDFYNQPKTRPGVVVTPPSIDTKFETEWAPMTTKIHNRNPLVTVFLMRRVEKVVEDSVILLTYRSWFKFFSLSKRIGKLSDKKQKELQQKLNYIRQLELKEKYD